MCMPRATHATRSPAVDEPVRRPRATISAREEAESLARMREREREGKKKKRERIRGEREEEKKVAETERGESVITREWQRP